MTDDELIVLRQIVQFARNIPEMERVAWSTKIDQHRDDLKKQKVAYDADVTAYKGEVTRLKQIMWDARALLGFDTDGDPTPAAVIGWPNGFLSDVQAAVDAHDEVSEEAERLSQEVMALQTADGYQKGHEYGFNAGYKAASREFMRTADAIIAILDLPGNDDL